MKALKYLLEIAVVGSLLFAVLGFSGAGLPYFQDLLLPFRNPPCVKPIAYSLGAFDGRFGLSQTEFLKDIAKARTVWDQAAGKKLFAYSPEGGLKINLIYDYRQEDENILKSLGLNIESTKENYNSLKAEYDSLFNTYNKDKASLTQAESAYNALKSSYESQVNYWNHRGGAPANQFLALNQEQSTLKAEADQINAGVISLNNLSDKINALADALNRLATELNLKVGTYNNVGSATGRSFIEGDYEQNGSNQVIDIYEFGSEAQLVRVLTHEFGHALGLNHVSDPKAVMYKYNEGTNDRLTAADLGELRRVCGLIR